MWHEHNVKMCVNVYTNIHTHFLSEDYKRIPFLLFKSLAPFTMSKIPEVIPATRMQMPMTRLAVPVEPRVL